ncbi:DNA internalization-related competence protein ComEC/Rec2 [Psychromonas marina]|nr:DNA internalization-related competence protein ComEC/Rec2 [Psychromonas marina]
MRTALLLSIFVFISTLFWPQLLDKHLVLLAVASFLLLLTSQLRILAVIPITALYFTCYVSLILTGQLFPSAQPDNKRGLEVLVDGKDHTIVVQIVSLISKNNRSYFNAKLLESDTYSFNYTPLIEMRWYKPEVILQAGQIHRFVARFKPVYGRANPAGFDRQKWSYSEHIGYRAAIKQHIQTINKETTLRANFYQQVQYATTNLTHQGLLLALSFADKSLIPFEEKKHIRNLGISHLFAISGLHIGLFFSAVYLLFQFTSSHLLPSSKMGWFSMRLISIGALIGAGGYAYLAGFSLPTQRAFLMLLVAISVFALKRNCSKVDLFLLVLFVVLVWDPLAVLSLSLWLSFSAVAIILVLLWSFPIRRIVSDGGDSHHHNDSTAVNKKSAIKGKIIGYFKLLLYLQVGLTLLMLPIQLVGFSALSLTSIVVNLIAVPLFSLLIIPLVLIAAITTLLAPQLALLLFTLCDQLIIYFFYLTDFLSTSYQWFSVAEQQRLLVIFMLLLLLVFLHFQGVLQRKLSYLFASLLLLLLFLPSATSKDEWSVDVIDVGQGLSVLVRSENKTLLYDTGARYPSGFNMVDSEIAPYLVSLGIKKLDYLIISHSDIDHAGGIEQLVQQFIISNRWSGEPLSSHADFLQCQQGMQWRLGKLNVEILSPTKLTNNDNNNSCVLRISDSKTSLLLTGDIEKRQETLLVNQLAEKLSSDILLAPHHGSRHSSSEAFIAAVNPSWVIFSAGFMNQWKFPADEVLERYQKQAVKMVNSGLSGLIRFQITAQAIKMQTFREDLAPYWYHQSLTSSPLDGHIDDK